MTDPNRRHTIADPKSFKSSGLNPKDPEDVAYHNGMTAAHRGQYIDDNPHQHRGERGTNISTSSRLHNAWKSGHQDYASSKRNEEHTMTESAHNVLTTIISGEPSDVKTAVETAITEKIYAALETKKVQIANALVGVDEATGGIISKGDPEHHWPTKSIVHKKAARRAEALEYLQQQAIAEGVEFDDEELELILEALLDEEDKDDKKPWKPWDKKDKKTDKKDKDCKITKETINYIRNNWFSEEELDEIKKKIAECDQTTDGLPGLGQTDSRNKSPSPPGKPSFSPKCLNPLQGPSGKGKGADLLAKYEEVNSLEELNKKTLGSYIKKASTNMQYKASFLGAKRSEKTGRKVGKKYLDQSERKVDNRLKGIERATNRLTKEEVEITDNPFDEVAPPGWETNVKHLKKHKDITNPWALAWWQKNRGEHSHLK